MQNNQVEEVKNKTDIVSIISEYIEVKKAGRNYKANCPFHGEKTPSFMISPELQMYKCFGCGKSGDVFTFIEEHEGMEFGETLKYLAEKAGVKLIFSNNDNHSDRERIIEVNNSAQKFFEYALNNHPEAKRVFEYLKKDRGLNEESIKKFNIGYSPNDFKALSNYLIQKKNYNINDLEKTGLLAGSKGRLFDRFKGRVIFPLFDHRGEVVGFAGRILPWDKQDMAKYINSPETAVYHKSKVLYGLNITKGEIRNSKFAIIVEGELDMISSYQAGIKNVIAIKGSALTEDQIRLINRFCQKIVLCLDSDTAGDEAAKRGAISAINLGFEVKVAHIKSYKDPDEAARKDPEAYRTAISEAVDIWDFLINQIFNKYDMGTGNGKASISREIIPLLQLIEDKIVQSYYIENVARRLSVPVDAVLGQISKQDVSNSSANIETYKVVDTKRDRRQIIEERLLLNLLTNEPQKIFNIEISSLFSSNIILKVISNLDTFFKTKKTFDMSTFSSFLPSELKSYFSEIILNNEENEDQTRLIKELKKIILKQTMEDLGLKIRESEAKTESDKVSEYQKEYSEIAKKLSALEED